ncbi:MAG: nitroreductase [Chloroflexi bacterium]|nr:nitroreductase [Chloroflexota bacterium]
MFDLIRSKRAIRQFTSDPIPDEIAHTILEAGRLSGSAKNQQPWHFVAVRDRETLRALSECGAYAGHMAGAALGVVLVTEDPYHRLTVPFDLGRATQNMMLTAWSHGIGSVMATLYESTKAGDLLGVPAGYAVCWGISFGYPAVDTDRPPRTGGRRGAEDVVHWEGW